MKDNWKSYLAISIIVGSFVAFNIFAIGPSDEDYKNAGIEIMNENNYKLLMSDSGKPIMILFKSKTCNVCKVFAPRFIDFAKTHNNLAKYIMADPDNVDFDHFQILAYPTTRIYYQGKILEELIGNGSLSVFENKLKSIK